MPSISTLDAREWGTTPRETRDRLSFKPGDSIDCSLLSDGTLILQPKIRRIGDLVHVLRRPSRPIVWIEEMRVVLPYADK